MSARLWISNVPPEASDQDVVDLVKRYCHGRQCEVIRREHSDSKRPGCIVAFSGLAVGELDTIARRLDGLYWKQRSLSAYHAVFPD